MTSFSGSGSESGLGHGTGSAAMPAAVAATLRSNSLAFAFQDVITVILRVRYRTQRVADAAAFRESIRKMIAAAAVEARRTGYSDGTTQMALYAIVGFLDESVLNSQDPTFADWLRRPLQEEMFGGHFAGEYFFRHVAELLHQADSTEGADALELHAVCLLLGYRGKFAFGNSGEIHSLVQQIRDKIARVRGPYALCRVADAPIITAGRGGDPWVRRLLWATAAMVLLCLLAFLGYTILLGNKLGNVAAVPGMAVAAVLPSARLPESAELATSTELQEELQDQCNKDWKGARGR